MKKSEFDKYGIDETGTHWLQYMALAFAGLALYIIWAYFFNDIFHDFVLKFFNFLNCSGFNPVSSYCIKLLR